MRDLLVLSRSRVQEIMEEAIEGGHVTRREGTNIARALIGAGLQQTQDVLADVEQLLGRGQSVAAAAGDVVLQQGDRVRRTAGIGSFPILRYDDLSSSQIAGRLKDLTAAQLRKVRDHERRNQQRKTILEAIERRLK